MTHKTGKSVRNTGNSSFIRSGLAINSPWYLEGDVLTVSNNVEMRSSNKYPWSDFKHLVKKIVVEENVTSLGHYAFSGFSVLKELVLFGGGAIGSRCFKDCTNLTKITIGKCVTSFVEEEKWFSFLDHTHHWYNKGTFTGCDNIEIINLTDIKAWCRLEHKEDLFIKSDHKSAITPTLYVNGSALPQNTLEIPEGFTNAGGVNFRYFTNVSHIILPSSYTIIREKEFSDYRHLSKITIPKGILTIGNSAFSGCTKLEVIEIPNSVKYIGSEAFAYCISLKELLLIGGGCIGSNCFKDCSNLEKITIGSGVISLESDHLFQAIHKDDLHGFYRDSFSGCDNITTIRFIDDSAKFNIKNIALLINRVKSI